MKRPLRYCDIAEGKKYRIIKKPEHLGNIHYPWIGRVGVCQWVNVPHGIKLLIDGCQEKIIAPEYVEEVIEEPKKEKMEITSKTARVGNLYRVNKIPEFWKEVASLNYPVLYKVGKLIKISDSGGILVFGIEEKQHFIPFSCLEDFQVIPTIIEISWLPFDEILSYMFLLFFFGGYH